MRRTQTVASESFEDSSRRIIRLLALYRLVAAFGAGALFLNVSPLSLNFHPALFFILFYGLIQIVVFALSDLVWQRLSMALTMLTSLDIVFTFLVSNLAGSLLPAVGMVPILVSHGWLLRTQLAIAHGAVFAIATVLSTVFEPLPLAQSGSLGLGALAAAALGVYLGRMGGQAMDLAQQRGEDLAKLSSLNQKIIDASDQGILVVDRDGYLLQANPQAERWLFESGVRISLPSPLMNVSQALGVQWANWREGFNVPEGGVVLGSGESQVRVRPRFVSTELRRAGDTVIFLEDLQLAQVQARQLKLAALGRLTANIAHEIRNPLTAVRQASQLLAESIADSDPTNRRLTEMIEKNVRRIDRIVTNVLSLTKRDRVRPERLEAQSVLTEMVADWRETNRVPAEAITVSAEPGLVLQMDRGHLEEIVWNLLANGWRHSKQGAKAVQVTARRGATGKTALIEVTDDGPGVAAEHRENIFEPFFSLSGSSGLGLFICRELAESNSGTLELTNHSPGAQFRLIVPAVSDSEFSE